MLSLFKYDLRRFVATNIELPITYLKKNLSAHGCVAKRFKMLTYYVYAPLFHRFAPCPEP
jgi:hypothetical protein